MTVQESALPGARSTPVAARGRIASYVRLLRVRQWIKNGFVLAGVFFSEQLLHASTALHSIAAALAFCFASSAIYVFNDIVDRKADAAHPEKRDRPLVTGEIKVRDASIVAFGFLAASAAVIAVVGFMWHVSAIIAAYVVVNIAYSLWLKHLAIVDVAVIASGFVLRLEAGIYAVRVRPSSWIVLCTGLLSLFLAFAKRRGDLVMEQETNRRSLKGYTIPYLDQVLGMMGAATVVVYALFTVSGYAQNRFHAPLLYLTTFPVVLGLLRYMQITLVEGRYASPAEVVLRDRPLQLTIAIWLGMFFLLTYR